MKNTIIEILTAVIIILLFWLSFTLEEPPTFDQSCLLSIVVFLGLLIFKE